MSVWLDTRGKAKIAIGICARCSEKMAYSDMLQDPNTPGLWVCKDDLDQFDPWRLPARQSDDITLDHPRPDVSLAPGDYNQYTNQLQMQLAYNPPGGGGRPAGTGAPITPFPLPQGGGFTIAIAPPITVLQQPNPWTANTVYPLGAQVTAVNPVGLLTAGTDLAVFLCTVPGMSGPDAPDWTSSQGVIVKDFQARWLNAGAFLP